MLRRNRGGTFFTMLIFIMLLVSSALMYYYFQKSRELEQQLIAVRNGEQPADSLAATIFNWSNTGQSTTQSGPDSAPGVDTTQTTEPQTAAQLNPVSTPQPVATPAALDLNPLAVTEQDTQPQPELATEEATDETSEMSPEPASTPEAGKIESIYDLAPPVVVRTPRSQ